MRNEADIYVGPYAVIPHVFNFVGFSSPFDELTYTVVSGEPQNLKQSSSAFMTVLGPDIWILFSLSWIAISLLYYLITRFGLKYVETFSAADESIVECLLTFYGLLFQRGFDNLPSNACRRLLVSGWLFLVIILMTDISGTLSAKLSVTEIPERIDKLEDILKYPDLIPYMPKGLVAETYLKNSEKKEYRDVYQQIINKGGAREFPLLMGRRVTQQIASGKAVALEVREAILELIVTQACKKRKSSFYFAKQNFNHALMVSLYRRGLHPDIVEKLNVILTRFGAMGFSQQAWKKLTGKGKPCMEMTFNKISYKAMTLRDLKEIFNLLGNGLALCVGTLLLEISFCKIQKLMGTKAE